jgi:hypothetical protein
VVDGSRRGDRTQSPLEKNAAPGAHLQEGIVRSQA